MHLILQISISRDTECVNTVGFQKLGHICRYIHSIQAIIWQSTYLANICIELISKHSIQMIFDHADSAILEWHNLKVEYLEIYDYHCKYMCFYNNVYLYNCMHIN